MKTLKINNNEEMEAVIAQCEVCFVAINDSENGPYVLPMNFGYEGGTLYLHSGPEGKKVELLQKDNRMCIAFCTGHELVHQSEQVACSYSMRSESVLCKGKAIAIEAPEEKRRALDIMMRHYCPGKSFRYGDPAVHNVRIWRVEIEEMTGKAFGRRGYERS